MWKFFWVIQENFSLVGKSILLSGCDNKNCADKKNCTFDCINFCFIFFKKILGFTLCKAEQPLRDMELQEKEAQKD